MPKLKEKLPKKHFLNTRQQLYKKHRIEGYSKYTSARKAGYSHAYATQAKKIENGINMDYFLEKAGLTDTFLADYIYKGLDAMKVISANIIYGDADSKTNDFIEVPDWPSRHKFLETVLKLQHKIIDKPIIQQSIHLTSIKQMVENVADFRKSRTVSSGMAREPKSIS